MAQESDQGLLEVRKHIEAEGKQLKKKVLCRRVAQGGKPSFEGVCGISYSLSFKIHTKWE